MPKIIKWVMLADLYQKLINKEHNTDAITSNKAIVELHAYIEDKQKQLSTSRTVKLWIQLMEFVSVVCLYIRAERIGNWQLHIKATEDIIPLFAAMGHHKCAKTCRLYLQDCYNMCQCLKKPVNDDYSLSEEVPYTGLVLGQI